MTILQHIKASLRRIGFLFRKEMLAILKDPANRAILIVPVIVQSMIFGYAATYDLNHVPYAVLNESHGAVSNDLLRQLDGSKVFIRVANLRNSTEIAQIINDGDALIALHLARTLMKNWRQRAARPCSLFLTGAIRRPPTWQPVT